MGKVKEKKSNVSQSIKNFPNLSLWLHLVVTYEKYTAFNKQVGSNNGLLCCLCKLHGNFIKF